MLLLVLVTILPFNLFHHHASEISVCCEINSFTPNNNSNHNTDFSFQEFKDLNTVENCLFCAWQLGAKLAYVVPEVVSFLPDFIKNELVEFQLTTVEVFADAAIPNKGPPTFLFS